MTSQIIPLDDDYEGKVSAKVDYLEVENATTAVIYLHGYMDYFFQNHLAEFFVNKRISFYALELRKYGSSLQAHHHDNFCKDIREYYEEIDYVLNMAKESGHKEIILHGHSTGGLLATHYFLHGKNKSLITAILLNSPFFAFKASKAEKTLLSIITPLGKYFPFIKVTQLDSIYTESLHKDYKGRWDFNLTYKPIPSFHTYLGWMRAISKAQKEIYQHTIEYTPALILHSDKSYTKTTWSEEVLHADAVLNVDDMVYYGEKIYKNLSMITINNAVHDIVLSSDDVIDNYFAAISTWLEQNPQFH